jgi:hypothetical protein
MKKLWPVIAITLLFITLYTTYKKIMPDYYIKVDETEYEFEEFFKDRINKESFTALSVEQKLERIYEGLKLLICQPSCEVTIFSFDNVPIDMNVEKMFYTTSALQTSETIQAARKKLASEQYFFSQMLPKNIIINDKSLELIRPNSDLPWIGRKLDGFFVEFIYAENLNAWFKPWIIRFIRDYRKISKIYVLPFQEGYDYTTQVKTLICLKEKQIFWDLYLNERLNVQEQECSPQQQSLSIPDKKELAIRLGQTTLANVESYLQLARQFQILYLSSKVQ